MTRILVLTYDNGREEYDPDDLVDPEHVGRRRPDRVCVSDDAEAEAWGRAILAVFNRTRRRGEAERVFVSARIEERADRAAKEPR